MSIKYNKDDLINHNSVGAIVFDNKGRVLVLDHIKYDFHTLPIGKANKNEDPDQKMGEELFEECNIRVESLKEIRRIKKQEVRNNRIVDMEIILYEILKWSGRVYNKEPDKHREAAFVTFEELLEKTDNGEKTSWITEMFIEYYKNKKVKVL